MPSEPTRLPLCANCGAKFSHDAALMCCTKCGIPDETVMAGRAAIARWRRHPTEVVTTAGGLVLVQKSSVSKRERKRALHARPASGQRRKLAHGRQHG